MRRAVSGFVMLAVLWGWGTVAWAFECPTRTEEARGAVQKAEAALDKAKAAAEAAAHGPLTKAKEMLSHAEAEHKGAGTDAKKHALIRVATASVGETRAGEIHE